MPDVVRLTVLPAGHVPALFDSYQLPRFLHAAIWKTFARVQPTIFDLIASDKDKHRELGAKLIAIAAISPLALSNDELALARDALARPTRPSPYHTHRMQA